MGPRLGEPCHAVHADACEIALRCMSAGVCECVRAEVEVHTVGFTCIVKWLTNSHR